MMKIYHIPAFVSPIAALFVFVCLVSCDRKVSTNNPVANDGAIPERIVSLGPAITEALYLLGVQDKLVGCTVYCNRPADAGRKEKVGTVVEMNVEKITALKPDLILATPLTAGKAVAKLRSLGMNVKSFGPADNFDLICEQFIELGKLTGKETEAVSLVAQASNRVAAVAARVTNTEKPGVFIQIGTKPLFAANRKSFINDYAIRAGGMNIADQAGNDAEYGIYSREWVVKKNPDVILVVAMGVAGDAEKQTWEAYDTLNAVRNKRIHVINSEDFCSPTPVGFARALEELAALLHPATRETETGK